MKIKSIPLSQLVPSPANVRKTGATTGVEQLAASIEAHGLLHNLQVRQGDGGKFEVVAGGRRLAALKALAKRKALAKDYPVSCHILTGEDATEISLAENEMRLAMHPADQFDAFKALIDAGHGIEDVAARFGVTPNVVRQRMKLAAVSPKLIALYRKGDMTLDQLMAFAISDDHEAQETAWFDATDWQRSAHAIRQRLTSEHVPATDWRAQFVGVDAYAKAGGVVIKDLFQTKSEGYLTDAALLDKLAAEKLEREADTIRAEGWKWVEIAPEIGFDALRGFEELRGKREPLPPKQAKALAKLEKQRDAMSEDDDLTDDQYERFQQIEAEIVALSETAVVFSDRQKARAGAFVGIGTDGKLDIVRGLVRPADIKAKKFREDDAGDGDIPAAASGLSRALMDDLTAHRTAALRAVLSDQPRVALAVAVHALALTVFYEDRDSVLAVHAQWPALRAEGIEDGAAMKRLAQLRGIWTTQLPEQPEALWDWLHEQDTDTLLALLAHCVACTVKPERGAAADRLAVAVKLDMAEWWQPTAAYFARVPKALIVEAVTEGASRAAADNIAALKKGEMADRAAELLTGTGWLPAMLRQAS